MHIYRVDSGWVRGSGPPKICQILYVSLSLNYAEMKRKFGLTSPTVLKIVDFYILLNLAPSAKRTFWSLNVVNSIYQTIKLMEQ